MSTTVQNNETGDNKVGFSVQKFNFFLGLGYDFQLIKDLVLQTRLNQRLDIQYDIDLLLVFEIRKTLGFGLYYSTLDKIGFVISGTILEAITLMYNFNIGFSEYYQGSAGMHEIGLLWKVPELKLVNLKNSRLTN